MHYNSILPSSCEIAYTFQVLGSTQQLVPLARFCIKEAVLHATRTTVHLGSQFIVISVRRSSVATKDKQVLYLLRMGSKIFLLLMLFTPGILGIPTPMETNDAVSTELLKADDVLQANENSHLPKGVSILETIYMHC